MVMLVPVEMASLVGLSLLGVDISPPIYLAIEDREVKKGDRAVHTCT